MTTDSVSNIAPVPQFHRAADQAGTAEVVRQCSIDAVVAVQYGNASPVTDDGFVRVVLTGSGADTALPSVLADDSGDIDQNQVLVFFGDERLVAAGSADRNALAARERFLPPVGVPEENIFELTAADNGMTTTEAAESCEAVAREKAPNGSDLYLLGMGGEGHINSIFPHTAALVERERSVVDVHNCPKPPPTRLILMMLATASSQRMWLLVAGDGKVEIITVIAQQDDPAQWPVAGARGAQETVIFVDDAAAAQLWAFVSPASSPETANPR